MASHKPRSRRHHHQPAPVPESVQQPDYGQVVYPDQLQYIEQPVLQEVSIEDVNASLNFRVLQRYIPDLYTIVHTAPYVVLYIFNNDTSSWDKAETEGTLFVCALHPQYVTDEVAIERYIVVILNRRALTNFTFDLTSADDVDVSEEYVVLTTEEDGAAKGYGLWIYAEENKSTETSRVDTARILIECGKRAQETAAAAQRLLPQISSDLMQTGSNTQPPPQYDAIPPQAGRQLTLLDLFGAPQTQNIAWENHSAPPVQPFPQQHQQLQHQHPYTHTPQPPLFHSNQPQTAQPIFSPEPIHGYATTAAVHETANQYAGVPQQQQAGTPGLFGRNADTDFFRRGPTGQAGDGGGGNTMLEELFRSARSG